MPPSPAPLFRALGLLSLFLFSVASHAQDYTTYDLVVPLTAPSEPSIIDGTGRLMPTNRSFVIGVEGGLRGTLVFTNWVATNPEYPVIIVNKHGTGRVVIKDDGVTYRDGIRFDRCAFVKLLGNNDPAHTYGFEVAQAGRMPSPGVTRVSRIGVNVANTSTNIEVGFVEVHHTGFAGIMAKSDPQQSRPDTWAENYTMYDLSIHDCYIHDVGGEGMYIGYNGWATDHWPEAPGFEGHEIIGLKIYNNLIERTMWDGFQYASSPGLDTEVYNNVVVTSGTAQEQFQANGVQIGSGASGKFYDNIVIDSFANSLAMFGRGYNAIYNNLLVGGTNGIFADNRPNPPPDDPDARQTVWGSYYSFYHNTIINPQGYAFWTMSEVTETSFHNNLSVVPSLDHTDAFAEPGSGASINAAGNVLFRSVAEAGFVDAANHDYRLQPTSDGIDGGTTIADPDVPVPFDIEGLERVQGASPDAGYSEHGSLSVFLLATPPATLGGTGEVHAAAVGGTPPYTYAWSGGATTATITNAAEGRHDVIVTDANGASVHRATVLIAGATMGAPAFATPAYQAAAPTFMVPGGTYASAQSVTIDSSTSGASIRYTLDGSTPSASHGTVYSGPITISHTATLRAIATKSGLNESVVATATYVIADGPANTKFALTAADVSASSHNGANVPENVIDGSLSTNWASNGAGQWIQFDLGSLQRIGLVKLATVAGSSRSYTFDLLASEDGSTWTPLLTDARTSLEMGLQDYDITDAQPVRHLRLVSYGNTNTATANGYTEIELWGGPVTASGPVPPTPSNLVATAGDGQVELDWPAVGAATSYNVRRATNSGGPFEIIAAGLVSTRYTDTDVINQSTYHYTVEALNLHGPSAPSSTASATPFGFPPPAPADLAATAADGQIGLRWSDEPEADSYAVKRALSPGGPYTVVASDIITPSFIDFNLTNGTTYHYVVTAVDPDGESPASNEASATPQAGLGGIWHILTPVSWGQSGGAYCPATYAFDDQPLWDDVNQTPVGDDHERHRSTLTEYANRFWHLDLGPDYASLRITQMWTRYRPNSEGTYNGWATAWWDDDTDNVNDGVTAPDMTFSAGGSLPNVNPQIWARDRDFSADPVTPQGPILVFGTGPTVSGRPNEFALVGYRDTSAPPAPPAGLTATARTTDSAPRIELAWSASPGASGYTLKRASNGTFTVIATELTETSFTDTSVSDGTAYTYVVLANNDRGESAASTSAEATADATPPELIVTANPSSLWPPDHAMVAVTVTADVEDAVDPSPHVEIVEITSNEPVNGPGDGNTSPDWEITGELTANLRAERAGNGSGRIYTLTVEARDATGNTRRATTTVTVPHDASQ